MVNEALTTFGRCDSVDVSISRRRPVDWRLVNVLPRRDAEASCGARAEGASRRRCGLSRSIERGGHNGAETIGSRRGFRGDVGYRGRSELVPEESHGEAGARSVPRFRSERLPGEALARRPRGVRRDAEGALAARSPASRRPSPAASRPNPKRPKRFSARPPRPPMTIVRRSARSSRPCSRAVRTRRRSWRRPSAAFVWLALCVAYAILHFPASGGGLAAARDFLLRPETVLLALGGARTDDPSVRLRRIGAPAAGIARLRRARSLRSRCGWRSRKRWRASRSPRFPRRSAGKSPRWATASSGRWPAPPSWRRSCVPRSRRSSAPIPTTNAAFAR